MTKAKKISARLGSSHKRAEELSDITIDLCKAYKGASDVILAIERRNDLSLQEKLWVCLKLEGVRRIMETKIELRT